MIEPKFNACPCCGYNFQDFSLIYPPHRLFHAKVFVRCEFCFHAGKKFNTDPYDKVLLDKSCEAAVGAWNNI